MTQWAARAVQSVGARHGLIMAAAMLLAGVFDYGVNMVIGQMLIPTQPGVFVAVTALLQEEAYIGRFLEQLLAQEL